MQCRVAYQLEKLNILCLDDKTDQVRIMSIAGKVISELRAKFKSPSRAAYNDKHIIILDKNRVFVFDTVGKYITEFGSAGSKDGQLKSAADIYLRNNRIYVVDSGNKRVQVFSLKGVYLDKLPKARDKKNPIIGKPVAIVVDANSTCVCGR